MLDTGFKYVFVIEFVFEYINFVCLYLNWKSQKGIYLYLKVGLYLNIICKCNQLHNITNIRQSIASYGLTGSRVKTGCYSYLW